MQIIFDEIGKPKLKNQAPSHQRCSPDSAEVLQQTLGVVDGGVKLRTGVLPLSVQILAAQRTSVTIHTHTHTRAERKRQ